MPALEPISERTEDRDNVNDGRGPGATSGFVWDDASRLQSIGHGGKWDDLSEKRTATARRSPPRQLPSDSNMEFQFAPRPITATNRNRVPGPIVASAAQPSSGLGSAHGSILERMQRRHRLPIKSQEGLTAQTPAPSTTVSARDPIDIGAGAQLSVSNTPTQRDSPAQRDDPNGQAESSMQTESSNNNAHSSVTGNGDEEQEVDLVLDSAWEQSVDKGNPTAMPDTAIQQHDIHGSHENMSDISAKPRPSGNTQCNIATVLPFQFTLPFVTSEPKPAHTPPNPTSQREGNVLAGQREATTFENPLSSHKAMAAPDYGHGMGSPGHRSDDRNRAEGPIRSIPAYVENEDDDDTLHSRTFSTTAPASETRQNIPIMPQRPASKSDRRNIGRPPPKKARDAPSVAKAIAILDWAWKQEVSGLQSEKHREVQLLNDQLSLSQEKCSSLSQQLETERAANMDLRDELDGTKSSLQDLSHRHASAKKFSDGLQNDLASRSKRNSSLEVEVDNLKEQLQTAKSELEEARQSCSSKETELQSSKKQFEDLQLDTEQRVKELEWKISDLERELLKKVDLLEKAQDEIARWQEKAENSEKIRQLIEAQMQMHQESVSSQVVALNSKIDDIQKFRNELRTQEIIQMLQDINSKELTSPQDMVEIENKIQGLAGRFDQNLNNIKEDLRARDSDKTSSDHTANKIIEHLELLKQDIDASSLLKEEIGELNIKITTLREKIKAKDAEISSMHEANKRLCEERDVLVDESRRGDARNTAENEDLRADLARARSDLAQANQDCESQLRQLASEREKLLQAKDSLRVAEEGLERLEKENVNVSDMNMREMENSLRLQVEAERTQQDQKAKHDSALQEANNKCQLAEAKLDLFKAESAKEHASETARMMSDFQGQLQSILLEHKQVLARAKQTWEAETESRLRHEQEKSVKQLHDLEADLQSLRASQNQGTPGSGTQENLFQSIIPGTQTSNSGEQQAPLHIAGQENRRPVPLSEIERMTGDDAAEDFSSQLSNLSTFIRSIPDVEPPPVAESKINSSVLPATAAIQEPSVLAAKAANPTNTKRKYDTIAPLGGQAKGDRPSTPGQSHGNQSQNGSGRFASIFERLEQQRSQQLADAQPSFESRAKGPTTRQQSNRPTAPVDMPDRPSKLARISRPAPAPLGTQASRNRQATPPTLTTVVGSPPHVKGERQKKAASTRKSRRIKQMDVMRAKFEEDGPSGRRKA